MKLVLSENLEKECRKFSTIALICGVGSLVIWFLALAGLGLGIRGAILAKRVNNTRYFIFSVSGAVLSLVSIVYHYLVG